MSRKKLRRTMPKSMRYAEAMGWELVQGCKNHPQLRRGRRLVVLSGTPSDPRADMNCRSLLRRFDREDGLVQA